MKDLATFMRDENLQELIKQCEKKARVAGTKTLKYTELTMKEPVEAIRDHPDIQRLIKQIKEVEANPNNMLFFVEEAMELAKEFDYKLT